MVREIKVTDAASFKLFAESIRRIADIVESNYKSIVSLEIKEGSHYFFLEVRFIDHALMK